jgi:NAD(P)-dependent dehydrogenase (short-subunit alcohol dehydrogenase family)
VGPSPATPEGKEQGGGAATPVLLERRAGSVGNVGSLATVLACPASRTQAGAKGALVNFTRTLAPGGRLRGYGSTRLPWGGSRPNERAGSTGPCFTERTVDSFRQAVRRPDEEVAKAVVPSRPTTPVSSPARAGRGRPPNPSRG